MDREVRLAPSGPVVSFSINRGILRTMVVDGKAIAAELYATLKTQVATLSRAPRLAVLTCDPQAATRQYVALKERKAREIGIEVVVEELPAAASTEDMLSAITAASTTSDGIIVQLPLPAHIDTDAVIAAIPSLLDVDQFSYDGASATILPPVVGAIAEIAVRHRIDFANKNIVVVGDGRLVGHPVRQWLEGRRLPVSVVTKDTVDATALYAAADILILGAGQPALIKPEMIKSDVVIFDAGTSEAAGKVVGDADPACAMCASLFTPVPGGIGPITLAILFRNLVLRAKEE